MKFDTYQVPTANPGPGKALFLLGQAEDGPVNTPVPIRNIGSAIGLFRSGNLIDAYRQVEKIPEITVYLMRITGEHARVTLLGHIEGEDIPVLEFRSIHGGSRYNRIRIYTRVIQRDGADKTALVIESPDSDVPGISYVLDDYENIYQLTYDINRDTRLKQNWVHVSSNHPFESPHVLGSINDTPTNMSGGDDGTRLAKDELYLALETTYSILEGRQVDVICPYPVRFDDTYPPSQPTGVYGKTIYGSGDYLALIDKERGNRSVSFHEQLIDFCRTQERFGITTHGVIGLREVDAPEKQKIRYMSRLLNASAFSDRYGLVEYQNGAWIDKGHYISICAQDFTFVEADIEANGCALYAGIVASLKPNQTTSNHQVPEGIELRFELSPEELKDLSFIGAIAARNSVKHGVVITNGVTAALQDSPFRNIQNIRMIQFTLYILNKALESSVGEAFIPTVTIKEIDQKVRAALNECVANKILKTYEYNVKLADYAEGIHITLQLMARHGIEFVDARANLTFRPGGEG